MKQRKKQIWKVISLILSLVTIGSSFFFHYDGKNSKEKEIVEALSERYEFVDKGMSYERALQEVDEEIEKLKLNNETLQEDMEESGKENEGLKIENANLQNQIAMLQNEYECSEKITLAESYAESGNYEVAIPILSSISEKTEDVVALLQNYTMNYENKIVGNAEALANDGRYDEAIALIDEALEIVPSSQVLNNEKENVTPKYLVETVECYRAENLWLLDSKEYIKMGGKSYQNAIFTQSSDIAGSMFNREYSANAFYNIDGEYSQLSGVAGHIDFSGSGTIGENDAGQVYSAEVTIWGDGKEICTITLSPEDTAKEFNYPVIGVKILEFRVKCSGNSKIGIAEIQIR
ncbi:MAG: hypothetical protein NC347_15745 [Clostridium sp.]|nr:hypothetical protein [Clostridium sp.]